MNRPRLHDTFTTPRHGPCIIARVFESTPGTVAALTWDGRSIWLYDFELRPLPTKEALRFPGIKVPDYRVPGVIDIVSLVVDLMAEPPQRIKSPLYPLLYRLEHAGDR